MSTFKALVNWQLRSMTTKRINPEVISLSRRPDCR